MSDASIAAQPKQATGRWFYPGMAGVFLIVAALGFAPTYILPLTQGAFSAPPIVHVHAFLFYAWVLFFCTQTWLVAGGRTIAHREWGMLGVALATAMVFAVFATVAAMINFRSAHGYAAEARGFAWVQGAGMLFFGGAVTAAIMNVKRPEIHKRLMMLATISLLDAPIARWSLILGGGPPPPVGAPPPIDALLPASLAADLLLLPAIVFDWRTRGRPHPVYLIGGAVLMLLQATRGPISETAAWRSIAGWLAGLGG